MKMKIAAVFLFLCMSHTCAKKRQYIDEPVTIDNWSGPVFNNNQQTEAFDQLLHGDTRGSKRMDLEGINPSEILNPIPEKPRVRKMKDEGPIAETYIGKDPDADKMIVVSPQDRLAHFVSKPIIHNDPIERSVAKHLRRRHFDMEDTLPSKSYMFRHHSKESGDHHRHRFEEDDRMDEDAGRRRIDDADSDNSEEKYERYNKEEELSKRFSGRDRGTFDRDRDQDKRVDDGFREFDSRHSKRSFIKKHKLHKKFKNRSEKKSQFSSVGSHIPEVLMPGGVPDSGTPMTDIPDPPSTVPSDAVDPSLIDNDDSSLPPMLGPVSEDGGSDMAVPNSPLSLSGVGVNSHSGVKEIAEHISPVQETDIPDSVNQLPVASKSEGNAVSEKVIDNEATFQDHSDNTVTLDGQGKEAVDQHTIFVHHHKQKASSEEGINQKEAASRRSHTKKHKIHQTDSNAHRPKKRFHLKKVISAIRRDHVSTPLQKMPVTNKNKKRWAHSIGPQHGFLEDDVANEYNNRAGGHGNPHLMTIGSSDAADMHHKEWNNMRVPENGYFSGDGLGPARSMEGEYIHHNSHYEPLFPAAHGGFHGHDQGMNEHGGYGFGGGRHMGGFGFTGGHMGGFSGEHMGGYADGHSGGFTGSHMGEYSGGHEMEGHAMGGYMGHAMDGDHGIDGGNAVDHGIFGGLAEGHMGNYEAMHSLAHSGSPSDHDTAGLIDAIWEHDYDGDHKGGPHVGYFEHGDQGTLLPSETLDGFAGEHGFAPTIHGAVHAGSHWGGNMGAAVVHDEGHPSAIQDIQDDTTIDSRLQTMGIGMEMNGHHGMHHHGHHGMDTPSMEHHDVGHYGNEFHGGPDEGNAQTPLPVNDQHHEMTPDQYHDHIDALMLKYHKLEEDLRGTHGTLMEHLDENLLHHHGHPHYHSGYDVYSYKNPWDNARLPYHVPVENHPDSSEPEGHVGGGSMEMGGKDDGKGEEKGGPLVEAKEESKPPPPKKDDDKKDDDKKEDKDDKDKPEKKPDPKPDWTGALPKIPKQRGGPDSSGSIELQANETTHSSGPSALTPLLQAIMAYKAMNLTVPASLQIQELKEELKEAREKEASFVTSRANHENAAAKDKEPAKQAETPNGAAEVTKAIQTLGSKAVSYDPRVAPQYQRLQQLNFLQQSYLKQMLQDAVAATKINQKPVPKEDKEQETVENILGLGHERDTSVQSAQLLTLLNNMLKQGASNVAFNNLQNAVQQTSNFVKQPSNDGVVTDVSAQPVSADSKSTGIEKTPDLTSVIGKNIDQAQASSGDDAGIKPTDTKLLTPSDAPTLDVPDNEKSNSATDKENSDSNDLIKLLNAANLTKPKKKHHKKKHERNPDDAYAMIGYVQAAASDGGYNVGAKKDTSSATITGNTKSYVTLKDISPAESPISFSDDEASKKNKIKTGTKKQ